MKRVGAAIGITGSRVTHMRRRTGLELEPLKARKVEGPDIERGHRIGPNAPFAVRTRLIDRNRRRTGLDDIAQEIAIAHARQARLLFRRRQPGEIVGLPFLDTHDVVARLVRQRRSGKNVAPRRAFACHHKLVGAEGLAVEENAARQSVCRIEILVGAFLGQSNRIDAECTQKAVGNCAIGPRGVDRVGSAIHQRQPAGEPEFIALGMAADIVVIIDNEDARIRAPGAIKIRRREPADAAADHN
jgi:hypothetical protein